MMVTWTRPPPGYIIARLSGKTKRVNITLPERLLAQMDGYAAQHGATRSGLIAEATMEYLAMRS